MKTLFLTYLMVVFVSASAQVDKYANSYVCKKGKAMFFSENVIENIDAESNSMVCALNTESKKVVAKVLMTSFVFKDKLMQEHFNENYLESDKYPSSVLDMVIVENIDFTKDGTYDVTLKGTLEMHGVKRNTEVKGKLVIKDNAPSLANATFTVKLAEYNIKIPKAVVLSLAEEIKVYVDFVFIKYQK